MIWEHPDGGEDDHEIADVFSLTPQDVSWALAHETPRRTKAAQRIA